MIKLCENAAEIQPLLTNSLTVKTVTDLQAYGTGYAFLTGWQQKNSAGECTALLCKKEDTFLLSCKKNADFSELWMFLNAVGFQYLQTNILPENWLPALNTVQRFNELQTVLKILEPAEMPLKNSFLKNELQPCYRILFNRTGEAIASVDYAGWYADLSHKVRRGAALCVSNGQAAAVLSHIYRNCAVISGVAVDESCQKQGQGRAALQALMQAAWPVENFYTCALPSTQPFYEACGFKPTGNTVFTAKRKEPTV